MTHTQAPTQHSTAQKAVDSDSTYIHGRHVEIIIINDDDAGL